LIALLAVSKIHFFWVIIIVGREFFVMGLRILALEHALTVHVSPIGKLKTFSQMVFLTVVIANPYQSLGIGNAGGWNSVEMLLLIITLFLSIFSAWRYYKGCMNQLYKLESTTSCKVEQLYGEQQTVE